MFGAQSETNPGGEGSAGYFFMYVFIYFYSNYKIISKQFLFLHEHSRFKPLDMTANVKQLFIRHQKKNKKQKKRTNITDKQRNNNNNKKKQKKTKQQQHQSPLMKMPSEAWAPTGVCFMAKFAHAMWPNSRGIAMYYSGGLFLF